MPRLSHTVTVKLTPTASDDGYEGTVELKTFEHATDEAGMAPTTYTAPHGTRDEVVEDIIDWIGEQLHETGPGDKTDEDDDEG